MGNVCSTDATSTAPHVQRHRHGDAAHATQRDAAPSQRTRAEGDMSSAPGVTPVLCDEPSAQAANEPRHLDDPQRRPFATIPRGHSLPSDSPTSKDILSPDAVSLSGANETSISGWSVSCPFGAVHGSLAKFPPLPPPPPIDDEVIEQVAAAPRQRKHVRGKHSGPPAAKNQQSISGWSVSSQNNCAHASLPPALPQQQNQQPQCHKNHAADNTLSPVVSGDYESISDWSAASQNQENAPSGGQTKAR